MTASTRAAAKAIKDVENYLREYVAFTDDAYTFALALWTAATYLWPSFDAFPYMVITSDTKRSGKTRLSELLSFACSNPFNASGVTPATIFRKIRDDKPVMFIDEAETLSSEAADTMRAVLNVGYRAGQVIPRIGKGGNVEEWPAYCPKVFILIGDVNDTLRDRAIIMRMKRADAPKRFLYQLAKGEGESLRERLSELVFENKDAIMSTYYGCEGLDFLSDRDEEIWMPLYALASVICPERMDEFTRIAVDMATEKTATARRYVELKDAEADAQGAEYKERLLRDVATVMREHDWKHIGTAQLLKALQDLPTGPWRKFRGTGLDAIDMSNLLDSFDVRPRPVRLEKGRGGKVARGYRKYDVDAALRRLDG